MGRRKFIKKIKKEFVSLQKIIITTKYKIMRALNNNEYIGGGIIRPAYVMTYEGQVVSEDYRSGHQIHKDKLVNMGWDRSLFKIKFKK